MRGIRIVVLVLLVGVLLVVGYASLTRNTRNLPEGDQEIAWIHAATSGVSWERFVGGLQRLEASPDGQALGLHCDYTNAFLDQTAAVPEVVLALDSSPQRLHIRWYKLTSTTDIGYWVHHLTGRAKPPLAIIGGGSSDRARDLARELYLTERQFGSRTPLLLITTATADRVYPGDERVEGHDLMHIYAQRSFRCCFTNSQMADALTDFVLHRPELRPVGPQSLAVAAVTAAPGSTPFGTAGLLAMSFPAPVFSLEWQDDPYSLDLGEQVREELRRRLSCRITNRRVPYSTGDYYQPNVPERAAVTELARELTRIPTQRPLLVLPAGDKPARRVLRALTASAPIEMRDAVALTGDSINLDVIFRDRATAWNIQEMPVPLVLFAHENPVDWKVVPGRAGPPNWTGCSATHDLLLNAKIGRLLVEAAWGLQSEERGTLVDSADELRDHLQALEPPFFDGAGNRLAASGAYIVWLQPHFDQGHVLPSSTISVWRGQAQGPADDRRWVWERQKQWQVDYADTTGFGR